MKLRKLATYVATVLLLLVSSSRAMAAATVLAPGDITIVTYNVGSTGSTTFLEFVCWVPINDGTTIKFTNNAWFGAAYSGNANSTGAARPNNQISVWNNNSGSTIPAGTVIRFSQDGSTCTHGVLSNIALSCACGGNNTGYMLMVTAGARCFVYQGSGSNPIAGSNTTDYSASGTAAANFYGTVLYGIGMQGASTSATGWLTTSGTAGTQLTYIPSNLVASSTYNMFFASSIRSGVYNGSRTGGTAASYKTAIANQANWSTSTSGSVTNNNTAFTLASASPSVTVTGQTNVTCYGASTGTATVSATGGAGGYSYSWAPSGGSSAIATGLSAGTYTCTVTDGASATGVATVTITQPASPVSGSRTITNVTCNGASTGAIDLTPSGGTPGYTYNWGGGVTTQDRTGLPAGGYSCTITDANGCTGTVTATVTQPTAVVGSTTQVNVLCRGNSTGSIDLTPSGGTPGYTYNWGGGITTQDRSGLAAGGYSCTITDANGCTGTVTATITQPAAVVGGSTTQVNVLCRGNSTGSIDLTPSGGTPGYTYNWGGGITTQDRSGLAAGSYTCVVTDANACTGTVTATVTQPAAVVGGNTSITNVTCGGTSTGAIDLTPSGGTPGYTYNWGGGVTTQDRTGLAAGSYTCVVTDANSCTGTVTATVTQPTMLVLPPSSMVTVTCFGGADGEAHVSVASGGSGGYSYDWTPGTPTGDGTRSITGLTAGVYACTVTDANSCTSTATFNVTQPAAVGGSNIITNVVCRGNSTGAINLTPSGGTPGYTYNWGGGVTTQDRTGLAAGSYTCVVTDANSCTGTVTATVTQPATVVSGSTIITNVVCNGGTTGAIDLTPSGGTPGYTYNWGGGVTTQDRSGIAAGGYSCVITDANSCTHTVTATLTQPTELGGSTIVTNVTCGGGSTGAIDLTPTGGTPGYTYNWGGGVTTQDRSGIAAGGYSCVITDANSCTHTVTATVTQPTPVSGSTSITNASCNGLTNGAINLTPSGGTGPYTFNWGGGITSEDRTGLGAGGYSCVVMDANGCTGTVTATVTQPTAVGGSTVVTDVACFGGTTGAINLTPSGGTPGYTYNWGGGVTTEDRTGLAHGTYTCVVTDANSCTGTVTATVTQPAAPVSGTTAVTNVACFGGTTGAINLTPNGGTAPYTFNWGGGIVTEDRTGLAQGGYTCTVTDANGCTGTVTATVTQPSSAVSGSTVVTNVVCNGGTTGSIDLTPSGGTPGYTYNWGGGITTQHRSGLAAGAYTCVVTDANACTGTVTATVTQPTAVGGGTTIGNVSCNGGTTGSIDLTPSGGTPGYTYNWGGGITTQDRTGLAAGAYTCVVTDANSCTGTVTATVTQPAAVGANTVVTNVACNGGTTGAINLTPTGGTPGYSFNWGGGVTTEDRTGLAHGTYTCVVTDANSCTATVTATVTQPAAPVGGSTAVINVACNGASTGSIDLTPSGGTPGYTYNWGGGITTQDRTGLAAGGYTCTVTDANSCTGTVTATVTQPTTPVGGSTVITNVACNGGTTGSIDLTPSGGTPGYTYNWGGGITTQHRSGLAAGAYTCVVTDANACTGTVTATVTQPTAVGGGTTIGNVSCNGGTTGSIDLTPSGGTPGYTYNWGGGITTQDRTGLAAGAYTCVVTDANSCTGTVTATVTQPSAPVSGSTSVTNVSCFGSANGAINLTPAGGTPGYTFNWGGGVTTEDRTGLLAGDYACVITDANSCSHTVTATVTQPANISTSGDATICPGDGTNLSASGAVTYTWSPATGLSDTTGASVTASPTITTTYTVTGTTGGCSNSLPLTVTVLPTYIITSSAGSNGTISPMGTVNVCHGTDQLYVITPDPGYHVADVTYDGGSVGTPTHFTVINVVAPHTVHATFAPDCVTPSAIAGTLVICNGSTTGLTNSVPDGTWSSSNPGVASVNTTTGVVTGNSAGVANITYSTGADLSCFVTAQVTINAVPAPIYLMGPTSVCEGFTVGLTNAMGSGTWSSADAGIATIGMTSGILTGIAPGTVIITYTQYTGCYTTRIQTVNMVPEPVTGTTIVCVGNTTTFSTLSTGGEWESSHPGVATVDSASGIATGVNGGLSTIRYVMPTGCFSAATLTVNHLPNAISGTMTMCEGGTTTLTSTTSGGTWSSLATGTATVGSATGVVTGVAAGITTISYTAGTGCSRTAEVTIDALPPAISGSANLCIGSTTTLTNATSGGTWTSSATARATVGLTTGIVTGMSAGTATITYKVPGAGCFVTMDVTVNATPSAITGTTNVCLTASTTLSHPDAGGTWSSANPAIGTVDASTGAVTGMSVGTTFITYTVSPGCFRTIVVNVTPLPVITTTGQVCEAATISMGFYPTGGTWASGSPANATVSTTGVVTGVSAGVALISYTKSPGCMSTTEITVNPIPAEITGNAEICIGNTETLSSTPTGGTWASSAPTKATVGSSSGDVTGVAAGNATITYTVAGCRRTKVVTVGAMPAAITGTLNVCAGSHTTLASSPAGGTWNSSNTAAATIPLTGTGTVTGVATGLTTISYTKSGCVRTATVTVNAALADIAGDLLVCVGNTSVLTNASTGGTWASSVPGKATVSPTTGMVTGIASGASIITYRTAATCYTTAQVTVNATLSGITGSTSICVGTTTTLSIAATGGTWASSNTSKATVDETTGVVTGVATGTSSISYIQSTGCYKVITITVKLSPAPLTGTGIVCAGSISSLYCTTGGGTWASSTTSVATVNTAGAVTGVAEGTSTITYTLYTGCQSTREVSVDPLPSPISGTAVICAGTDNLFSASPAGGTWVSSTPTTATVGSATGVVTGLISGATTLSYTLPTGCRRTQVVTVNPQPAAISGTASVYVGMTTTLTSSTTGGTWSSSDGAIATVASGVVTGMDAGTATITYQLTSTGCFRTREVTVNYLASGRPATEMAQSDEATVFSVYPNPTTGTLAIKAQVNGTFTVYTLDGKQMAQYPITTAATSVTLPYDLAAGIYMCRFNGADGSSQIVRLVYQP